MLQRGHSIDHQPPLSYFTVVERLLEAELEQAHLKTELERVKANEMQKNIEIEVSLSAGRYAPRALELRASYICWQQRVECLKLLADLCPW